MLLRSEESAKKSSFDSFFPSYMSRNHKATRGKRTLQFSFPAGVRVVHQNSTILLPEGSIFTVYVLG